MLKNFKLKEHILWGYSIPIILSVIGAGLVYIDTQKVAEQSRLLEAAHVEVEQLLKAELDFVRMQKEARGYFLTREEGFFNGYDEATINLYKGLDLLLKKVDDKNQQETLKQIKVFSQQIDQLYRKAIQIAKIGKVDQATQLWRNEIVPLLKENQDLINNFNSREETILNEERQIQNQGLQFLNAVVILSTLLSASLAIGIGLLITSRITERINDTVSAIASSSTEIAATVEQQERTAAQQANSVNQTATTISQLSASSRASAEQAEAAAVGAAQVLTLVKGNDYRGAGEASSLQGKVEQITQQILRLGEQTQQIGAISIVVSELANQTNMLALNAAVEAVRAGEHGKGFSVVASEIRKLADESKKSAERINTLVTDIQNATNSTIIVTESGKRTVESVGVAVGNIAMNAEQISLTAKAQAVAIEQMVAAMNSINQGAAQTATGISQTKVGTQRLNEAANNLKAVV